MPETMKQESGATKSTKSKTEDRTAHVPAEMKEEAKKEISLAERRQNAVADFERREKNRLASALPPHEPGERRIIISTKGHTTFQGYEDASQMLGDIDLFCNPTQLKQNVAAMINQAQAQAAQRQAGKG